MINDSLDESFAISNRSFEENDGETALEWSEALLYDGSSTNTNTLVNLNNQNAELSRVLKETFLRLSLPLIVLKQWTKLSQRSMIASFYHWKSCVSFDRQADRFCDKVLVINNSHDLDAQSRAADIFVSDRSVDDLFSHEISQAGAKLFRVFSNFQSGQSIYRYFRKWKDTTQLKKRIDELPIGLTVLVVAKHRMIWEAFINYHRVDNAFTPEKTKSVGSKLLNSFLGRSNSQTITKSKDFSSDHQTLFVTDDRSSYERACLTVHEMWQLLCDCNVAPDFLTRDKFDSFLNDALDFPGRSPMIDSAKKKKKKFKISKMIRKGSQLFSTQAKKLDNRLSFLTFLQLLWEIIFDHMDAEISPHTIKATKEIILFHPSAKLKNMLCHVNDGNWHAMLNIK